MFHNGQLRYKEMSRLYLTEDKAKNLDLLIPGLGFVFCLFFVAVTKYLRLDNLERKEVYLAHIFLEVQEYSINIYLASTEGLMAEGKWASEGKRDREMELTYIITHSEEN